MKGRGAQAAAVLKGLRELYPDAHCELDFRNPLELLVATILSAQCTDRRVNVITRPLFKKYRTAADYAQAEEETLAAEIRSAGFYRMKTKAIRAAARALMESHGGKVPRTMEELTKLRGVARKTANVILGTAFGLAEGIVVDTHMKRVSYRLGLTKESDPVKAEQDLMACVPREDWIFFGHAMVWHGRRVCKAATPNCPGCLLNEICLQRGV